MLCHETPGNSIFIKFSIASRWVKNTSWLVETDPPIQIALVCFFQRPKILQWSHLLHKPFLELSIITLLVILIFWFCHSRKSNELLQLWYVDLCWFMLIYLILVYLDFSWFILFVKTKLFAVFYKCFFVLFYVLMLIFHLFDDFIFLS